MKLSIVLSSQPTKFGAVALAGEFERNLALIASLGYQGVELAIRDPRLVNQFELLAIIERYKLEAPAIGTGQAWVEERLSFTDPNPDVRRLALERAISHLAFAAKAKALVIIGLLRGVIHKEVRPVQAMDWLIGALCGLTELAEAHNVRLCIEPLNRYETGLINTAAEGLELIKNVGSPSLGLLLDTFHMNIEEPDPIKAIDRAGEKLFHFHVADSNRWYPGAGHIDFRSLLICLRANNYRGFISGEFLPLPEANQAAELAIDYLRTIL